MIQEQRYFHRLKHWLILPYQLHIRGVVLFVIFYRPYQDQKYNSPLSWEILSDQSLLLYMDHYHRVHLYRYSLESYIGWEDFFLYYRVEKGGVFPLSKQKKYHRWYFLLLPLKLMMIPLLELLHENKTNQNSLVLIQEISTRETKEQFNIS